MPIRSPTLTASVLAAVVLVALAGGCAPGLRSYDYSRGEVALEVEGLDAPVTLTYLGVGGWLLDTGRSRLLTAPLFSNPPLLRAGFAPIGPDSAAVERALRLLDVPDLGDVAAILVGHGHYDHLMDVPYVATRHAPRALVLGSATVVRTLAPFEELDGTRLRAVDDSAATMAGGGGWIGVADDLRVLPILSDHAPHLQGVTLYDGERAEPMRRRPRAADDWLEGETLAWLIDVLAPSGATRFRLYYQDAVAREPFGLIPAELAPVDVALLVPATFAEVDWQPEAVLENTRARHVLLGHWENFFQPVSRDPEPVPFTLLPDFVARLRRALDGDDTRWDLPVPGTRFVFR
jgi:L-ascorbate metabolism protein UlaG (beta-lactamase superfamily)